MESIYIKITSDAAELKSTIDALEKLGKVDKSNAEQFNKHHAEHKKRSGEAIDFNTKVSRSIKDLGEGIIAAFAVEKLIDKMMELGAESIKAFEEAETARNTLEFGVKNLLKEGDKAFKGLIEQAEALSKKINNLYSPRQIQEAQAQLVQAKVSSERIMQVMPLIADVAAKSHKSIGQVTELFVRGMQGNTRALIDFNAKFKDTGNEIQNFNGIVDALAGYTGGAEQAMGDLANRSQELKNNNEVMAEQIGKGLAPVWENLKEKIYGAVKGLGEFIGLIPVLDEAARAEKRHTDNVEHTADIFKKASKEALQAQYDVVHAHAESARAVQLSIYNEIKAAEARKDLYGQAKENLLVNLELKNKAAQKELEGYLDELTGLQKVGEEREKALKAKQKDDEDAAKREVSLKDWTLQKLKEREDAVESKSGEFESLDTLGQQKEMARIAAERKRQEEEAKKKLAAAKKIDEELAAIRKKDDETRAKDAIESIDDETKKKEAQANENFRKESVELEERKAKLNEIIKNGDGKQRAEAKKELDTFGELEFNALKANAAELAKIQEDAGNKKLNAIKKTNEAALKAETDANNITIHQKELAAKKEFMDSDQSVKEKEKYDKKIAQLEIDKMNGLIAIDKKYGIDTKQLEIDRDSAVLDLKKKNLKEEKKLIKEVVKEAQEAAEAIINIFETATQANIDAIDHQETVQKESVGTQKELAKQGLENELAYQQRRTVELEKARLIEQKKLKKEKELETFLNSLAKFAETDPKTALPKALAVLATAKVAEAVFAEEGGILGQGVLLNPSTKKHRSGNDILVNAERGEGILSVKEMDNLGANNFFALKNYLKSPLIEKKFNMNASVSMHSNADVISKLDELQQTIKHKKEMSVDFDKLGEMIVTTVEHGVMEVQRKQLRKPRI